MGRITTTIKYIHVHTTFVKNFIWHGICLARCMPIARDKKTMFNSDESIITGMDIHPTIPVKPMQQRAKRRIKKRKKKLDKPRKV